MKRKRRPRSVKWQVEEYGTCIGWRPAGDTGYCANCGRPQVIHEPWLSAVLDQISKLDDEEGDDGNTG